MKLETVKTCPKCGGPLRVEYGAVVIYSVNAKGRLQRRPQITPEEGPFVYCGSIKNTCGLETIDGLTVYKGRIVRETT